MTSLRFLSFIFIEMSSHPIPLCKGGEQVGLMDSSHLVIPYLRN